MTRTVEASPRCDTANIYQRTSSMFDKQRSGDTAFVCEQCGHNFEKPVRRENQGTGNEQRGAARALLDANPEEYPK